jgi:hypothetical protein
MLLLESYARNYWKMQSKYLTDKPATRKLVELLVRRNDKFSRRLLVEMMQLREEETKTQSDLDDSIKQYQDIGDKITKLIQRLLDKGPKFRIDMKLKDPNKKLNIDSDEITVLIARDMESAGIIKQIEEYSNISSDLAKEITAKGHTINKRTLAVTDPETKEIINNVAITKLELGKGESAKSALERILMFFGTNFKLLWKKLTTKYKLAFWGSIILGLLIVALVTIYKYGKENAIAKVIKNVLIASLAGFALYNLIVLIMSLKDQFSKEITIVQPY